MLQTQIKPGKPEIKKQPSPTYDVSGVIGVSGEATGSITLSFPKLVALKVVSKFIETEIKIIGADVTDAVGELTNIIAGSAKKDLKNFRVAISLPKVVIGKNHSVNSPKNTEDILIPFDSPFGNFNLEVSLKPV